MKRLIVTADDVGVHRGMTMGAVRAHRHGLVTACSVVANGRALDHAVEELARCPSLDVGAHLTLVGERPVSPPARVRSLVTGDGTMAASAGQFLRRWLRDPSPAEVELELRAQIERLLERGLVLSHLNGHQHLHVLPGILGVVLRLARDYRIPYVRIPIDRMPRGVPAGRRLAVAALARVAARARSRARRAGLTVNDVTLGVAWAGHLDGERLQRLLPSVSGVTELVTHPGVGGDDIARAYDWGYDWDAETAALCDPGLPQRLDRLGIAVSGILEMVR